MGYTWFGGERMKIPKKEQEAIVTYWRSHSMAATMLRFGKGRKTVLKILAAAQVTPRTAGRPEVEV